ncbi:YhbY family RNA-binding protein [Aerococcus christensenii]|uniref:YhbY family RNA-binding protein n=1 Tax=Aerococcus christensenii TaxID=87541 RepID=UPI00254BAB3A|nr:YhbY family RNA-binding protein [Aerococcus christensenii]MDK8234058.1 YhbY family RNA-binding protein [Aerococcus christensenii]
MNNKQKKAIKQVGQFLKPIFQIGKNDLTDEMIEQFDYALEKREIIKISILQNSAVTAEEALGELEETLHLEFAYSIGHTLVLYRASQQMKKRDLSLRVAALEG